MITTQNYIAVELRVEGPIYSRFGQAKNRQIPVTFGGILDKGLGKVCTRKTRRSIGPEVIHGDICVR